MTTGLCLLRTLVHRWPLEPKTVHAKALNFIKIINVYMNLYKNINTVYGRVHYAPNSSPARLSSRIVQVMCNSA